LIFLIVSYLFLVTSTAPEKIFTYNTSGFAQQLASSESYLAVASGGGGVYLFDIKDPDNITFMDRIDDSEIGYVYKVAVQENYLFAATRKGVVKIKINQ